MTDIGGIMIVDWQLCRSLVVCSTVHWSDNNWQNRQYIDRFDKYHRREFILCTNYFPVWNLRRIGGKHLLMMQINSCREELRMYRNWSSKIH